MFTQIETQYSNSTSPDGYVVTVRLLLELAEGDPAIAAKVHKLIKEEYGPALPQIWIHNSLAEFDRRGHIDRLDLNDCANDLRRISPYVVDDPDELNVEESENTEKTDPSDAAIKTVEEALQGVENTLNNTKKEFSDYIRNIFGKGTRK